MGSDETLGPTYSDSTSEAQQGKRSVGELPQIDGYEILGFLGQGGMGTVYRAIQLSTRRQVALKVLGSSSFISAKARSRFELEVELMAGLEHPNIARVYDSGVRQGVCYYAMELIYGRDLAGAATYYQPTKRQVLELMRTVCEAVQYAHQRGIIHRDLKPSNVMVGHDGRPHVLDFGLARTTPGTDPRASFSIDGVPMGTVAYMSPEQARGSNRALDIRTDVYSLGVILYELLTRRLPHDVTGAPWEVMRRIAEEPIRRPRSAARQIDGDLEAVLLEALAQDPRDRYASAGELAADIERYLHGEAVLARPLGTAYRLVRRLRNHWRSFSISLAVALALAGVAVAAVLWVSRIRQAAMEDARRRALQAWQALDQEEASPIPEVEAKHRGVETAWRAVEDYRSRRDLRGLRNACDAMARAIAEFRAIHDEARSARQSRDEAESAARALRASVLHRPPGRITRDLWAQGDSCLISARACYQRGRFREADELWRRAAEFHGKACVAAAYPVEPTEDLSFLGLALKDPNRVAFTKAGVALFDDRTLPTEGASTAGEGQPPSGRAISIYRIPADTAKDLRVRFAGIYMRRAQLEESLRNAALAKPDRMQGVLEFDALVALFHDVQALGLSPGEMASGYRAMAGKLKPLGMSEAAFLRVLANALRRLAPTEGPGGLWIPAEPLAATSPSRRATPVVVQLRTVAFSPAIPLMERVNHSALSPLLQGCPVSVGQHLDPNKVVDYASRLSHASRQQVNVALSDGTAAGDVVVDLLVLGDPNEVARSVK